MGAVVSCCGCRRRCLSPPPAPYLPDDVLADILVRLPPHPADVRRVSLVSEQFRRVVTDHKFLREVRARHGNAPPLVGFFSNHDTHRFLPTGGGVVRVPDRVAARGGAGALGPDDAYWLVVGSRHGRVLLLSPDRLRLLVLEPMAGRRHYVPTPPEYKPTYFSNAAVLCAADHTVHDDCLSCPYRIIFVSSHHNNQAVVSIYSSETGVWSNKASGEMSSAVDMRPSVLGGTMLYWQLISHSILAFNLDTHDLFEILVPAGVYDNNYEANLNIVAAKDGKLGLTVVAGYVLTVWEFRMHGEGALEWVLRKLVWLDALLPLRKARFRTPPSPTEEPPVWIMGIDEDTTVAFLWTKAGVFSLQLETICLEKVFETCRRMDILYPYKSFFIAAGS